jgi:hypothetical protein
MSVISAFDGDSCALFDGRIGVDRSPTRPSVAAVLAAVKGATRRWRGEPEDGPPLTAAARDGSGCAQVGTEGWCRSNKRMRLPYAASRTLYRVREAEVPDSCATITVMKNISFRSGFESPIKLGASNSVP